MRVDARRRHAALPQEGPQLPVPTDARQGQPRRRERRQGGVPDARPAGRAAAGDPKQRASTPWLREFEEARYLEQGLEGLLHISELADHKVENPEDVVKVGQKVEVRVIKIDTDERKIGLTLIQAHFEQGEGAAPVETQPQQPAAPITPALGSLADQLKGIGQRVSAREAEGEPEDAAVGEGEVAATETAEEPTDEAKDSE